MKRGRSWALCAAAVTLASPALALEGEREASLALVAGTDDVARPLASAAGGLDAQLLWHTSDFWAFGGGVRARAWSGAAVGVAVEGVARWTLDALQWIPSLGVAVGYQADPLEPRLGPALRVEASLAWRRHREHAWVFRLQGESARAGWLAPDRFLVGFGLVWYSGKGEAFEL